MAKFTYTATSATNPSKMITGEIEANSREDVVSSLGKQHLNPVSIKEGKKAGVHECLPDSDRQSRRQRNVYEFDIE